MAYRKGANREIKMAKVIKIEEIDTPDYVYDPVCSFPHAYISNGIVSHNCVCFLDEVDKALGGIQGSGDSGAGSRVLGTILTWMQEHKHPVFTVVTANDISALPAELLRRGRMDEVFYTQYPTEREYREVLDIHLHKRGYNMAELDRNSIDEIVQLAVSNRNVAVEIEHAVIAALISAFSSRKELEATDILIALADIVPLSKMYKAKMDHLLEWGKNNAKPTAYELDTRPPAIPSRVRRSRTIRSGAQNDDRKPH